VKITFHPMAKEETHLTFVVIVARFRGKWLYVKHRDRSTWEVPGGHIENGESPDVAAVRELVEETTALEYHLIPLMDYGVEKEGIKNYGRLYFAEIYELNESFEFEIETYGLYEEMPVALTYPKIQPYLFGAVRDMIGGIDLGSIESLHVEANDLESTKFLEVTVFRRDGKAIMKIPSVVVS